MTNPARAEHSSRKSVVQIRFEILEFLYYNRVNARTELWRHATRLSYDDFQKYLEYLKAKGFVEEKERTIILSTAGREVYMKLKEALPSIF
jgi:predicted transcriptional regulator